MKPAVLSVIALLFVFSLVIFFGIAGKVKGYNQSKPLNLLYVLLGGLIFGIGGLSGFFGLSEDPYKFFIVLQVLALVVGIIHAMIYPRVLPWAGTASFWGRFLFSLVVVFLGALFLLLSFMVVGLKAHQFLLLSAIAWFLVPFFFRIAFESYLSIPEKIFKDWVYPLNEKIPDPTDDELASPIVIGFEFQKKTDDKELTNFRAKAPREMQFGRLFYYFINDYNDRHPEETIEVTDDQNNVYSWLFFHKPGWHTGKRFIDPEKPVQVNHIKENSVIVCQRLHHTS